MNEVTAEAIDKIVHLAEGREKTVEIGGNTYSRFNYSKVFSDPRPSKLNFMTLEGMADYIKGNLDKVEEDKCQIIIDDYDKVSLHSPVKGDKNDRHLIAVTELSGIDKFQFGRFLPQEEFIISFSSLFCNNLDKESVMDCVAHMSVKMETTGDDNGAGTTLKASNGIITDKDAPGPVVQLSPFRTFRELDQPESAFIFRYKAIDGTPTIALFEADGGAWKLEARRRIKAYLSEKLEQTPIFF